jgi:hypothetical protein
VEAGCAAFANGFAGFFAGLAFCGAPGVEHSKNNESNTRESFSLRHFVMNAVGHVQAAAAPFPIYRYFSLAVTRDRS